MLQKMGVYVSYNSWNDISSYLSFHNNVYEYIFVSRFHLMNSLYDTIRRVCPKSKLVYVTHDLHSLREERQNKILNVKNDKLKTKEVNLIKRCDLVLISSSYEYELLKNITNDMLFPILYESVDLKICKTAREKYGFYFIGSCHDPNIDAVEYFLENVYHKILKIQNIPFYIVGSCCSKISPQYKKLYENHIHLIEYITDMEFINFSNHVRMCLIPLRFGAGVKGKLLQAMNHCIPTISTSIGVEGTSFQDMRDVIVMDVDNPDYVSQFVFYYNNVELLDKIALNGKRNFEENYSTTHGEKYTKAMLEILDNKELVLKPKICVIFNTYNKPEVIKLLKTYLESMEGTAEFEYHLVINGPCKLDDSFDHFNPMEGDNTMNEFSGIQKCLDMLRTTKKVEEYDSFILCNDTISTHFPLAFFYTISKDEIDITCRNRYVVGWIDSFGESYSVDNFTIKAWYRTFFVMINAGIMRDINYKFWNYRLEDIYEYGKLKINIDPKMKENIDKILGNDRYKNRTDLDKKFCCIMNEYRFSYEITSITHSLFL